MTNTNARLEKHSVRIAGHASSVSLERIFWQLLKDIAKRRETPVSVLVGQIDRTRTGNLSSALRVFVLEEMEAGGNINTERNPACSELS
ncbi:MAG: ribbon-helix-helix domain-containing protein [Pseudomonadota bacterium]|nr:ribbon-helix-helix domain-containing protein [Pseudomonadota bacterium]